jgi:hypothetical protein
MFVSFVYNAPDNSRTMSTADTAVPKEKRTHLEISRRRHDYYMSHREQWTTRQAAIKRDPELHERLKQQQRESSKRRYAQREKKTNEMFHCRCGSTFRQVGTKAHLLTRKHKAYVLTQGSVDPT